MDEEIDLDEIEELEAMGIDIRESGILDELDADLVSEDEIDPEEAYNLGRLSDIDDDSEECPYEDDQEAADEWRRGRSDADRHDIYAIRRGSPPEHYRDPD